MNFSRSRDQHIAELVDALLASSRSRSSWNERLAHWERPASETEEVQIQRSASMVRAALNKNPWVASEGVQVRAQGSYYNNTNVRQDSDMDLCAWHPGIKVEAEQGLSIEEVDSQLGYTRSSGRLIPDIAAQLRCEVGDALRAQFDAANVKDGSKAFRVSAVPGSRADADVVPAVRLHYAFRRGSGVFSTLDYVEGVVIYAQDGTQTLNFPAQHHGNGKAKRERTRHRFKKIVRCAKRLRDELVMLGTLSQGQAPSFLVESLVHGVEDSAFLFAEDRYDRMRRVLARIGEQVFSPDITAIAREINDIKWLFHVSQPWTLSDAQAFVTAAQRRLDA